MKTSKRAIRRAHKERMKAKARRIYPHDIHGKAADHLKVCSCWSCGNPRKYFTGHWGSDTLQERIADISFKEQLNINEGEHYAQRTRRPNTPK